MKKEIAVRRVPFRSHIGICGLVAALVLLLGAFPAGAGTDDGPTPRANWDDYYNPRWFSDPLAYQDIDKDTDWTTIQGGEPSTPCGGVGSHSVWYAYQPGEDARIVADTFQSDYDTVLAVYRDNWNTEIACNDDSWGTAESQVWLSVYSGHTYYFRVSEYNAGGSGGSLWFTVQRAGPANDKFADTQPVGTDPLWTASTVGATTEASEPLASCEGNLFGATAWYSLTVTVDSSVTVDTFGSDFDTVLAVYTGPSLGSLSRVTCDDDTSGVQSRVQFSAVPGTTYYIQAGGYDSPSAIPQMGNLVLNITRTATGAACQGEAATRTGTAGADTIYGTAGADVIVGLGGNDIIYGQGGNDLICAGTGADTLYGGTGADRLYGQAGNDILYGGGGNDRLYGTGGNDQLFGQTGYDILRGGVGTDTCATGENVVC
jgi:Ca2+-binding RTX toxin-like protein